MKSNLKLLSVDDGMDIYKMLKRIGAKENSFTNPVHQMEYSQFKEWLVEQSDWHQDINLPKGYVGQSIFWLYISDIPVGIAKIRHELTDESRKNGGNIGYAIDPNFRGKGYGNEILKLLILEAKKMNITEILLTVDKYNYPSRRVIENNGGYIIDENADRWFFNLKKGDTICTI